VITNNNSSFQPNGQFITEKFPVLTHGASPMIDLKTWRFQISGEVEREIELTWDEIIQLPSISLTADFHCVTHWSRLKNIWDGVPCQAILRLASPLPLTRYVMVHCYGGYFTNIEISELDQPTSLFAFNHDGKPLDRDHGAPLRLIVPKRYGWKNAKWVRRIEFMTENRLGFWEQRGYHVRGEARNEERYST
jgi:DMSO/TMAO reductase YedYZ molybdopterin-dependent catalytic subunit